MFNTINGTWYSNNTIGGNLNTYTGIDPALTSGGYTTTTTIPNTSTVIPTSKRCRDCNHAHLNNECIEFTDWGSVTFVKCTCKEYAPKDNLEYLEHLYDKKQRKESTPSL